MLLEEKGELVSDENNKFFINITKLLNSKEDQGSPLVTLEDLLKKFVFHTSIHKIRQTHKSYKKFSFQ